MLEKRLGLGVTNTFVIQIVPNRDGFAKVDNSEVQRSDRSRPYIKVRTPIPLPRRSSFLV